MTMIATDNPVMQAEFKHQRRVITTSRSGWFWIVLAMLMLVPALLAAVVMIVAALIGVDLEPLFAPPLLSVIAEIGVVSVLVMNLALYVVVTLVTLALAANSISREQESHTWEHLLLTNMTSRQIVQGKWWATLRALWGDHLMVLILRLGAVTWIDFMGSDPDLPNPSKTLVGLLVIAAFTIADSALTVIMGILPPVSGRNPVVLVLRLVISAVIVVVSFGIGLLVHEWNPTLVAGVIAGMVAYVVMTVGMLRFAEWAAVRNLASPSQPMAEG